MRRWLPAVLCALALFPYRVVASEPAAETLTERLLEVGAFRESITDLVSGSVPPGTASKLAVAIVKNDEQTWKALRSDLPGLIEKRLAPERIRDLARSYGEAPEAEWVRSGAEMTALVKTLMIEDTSFRRIVARQACAIGFLAPNIDRAKEKAGKSGDAGSPADMPPEVFAEFSRTFLRPLDETCDCILRRGVETFGERFYSAELAKEDRSRFVLGLIGEGECPNPFDSAEESPAQ